ncbi:NUDIX domain-containing protein [Nocardia sp. NPDC004568]|uniref:NUDIX hydrolase n=1 Tax=Nocardia sp. NPDC004568 TaxID=3154551 RepID=UPI0033A9874F
MRSAVRAVHEIVTAITPIDELERAQLAEAANWVARTDDIFRRARPATFGRHLVSYVVVVDPTGDAVFLVHHIKAGRWLPPGGHVEPGEHPALTARREAAEELGVTAAPGLHHDPLFLTITTTVGIDGGHEDVSLWYVLVADRSTEFTLDPGEFHAGRWWGMDEVAGAEPAGFDPHFPRFLAKLRRVLAAGGPSRYPMRPVADDIPWSPSDP